MIQSSHWLTDTSIKQVSIGHFYYNFYFVFKMSESGQIFHFKQFDIAQDRCAMKVGTDGVLLGAWAGSDMEGSRRVRKVQTGSKRSEEAEGTQDEDLKTFEIQSLLETPQVLKVLDIGTGTGLIALMLAQRCNDLQKDFHIDAIEIDPSAAQQAAENAASSPWDKQIAVHPCSLAEYMVNRASNSPTYDLILSNPPFYNGTLKPEDQARATARHKDSLPLKEIMQCAQQTLSSQGRLSMIYPSDYDNEVMETAILAGLKPLRICNILTKVGKPCKRRMAEFCRNDIAQETTFETLSMRNEDGNYSDQYINLTLPFYTHLKG